MNETSAAVAKNPVWVFTCGCGNNVTLRNAGVVCSTDGCAHCAAVIAHQDDVFDPLDGLVGKHLGFCGCANPERLDALMLDYLTGIDFDSDHWDQRAPVPDPGAMADLHLLVAYIADALGWTEHGGGVYGAWLTDDGREALTNLRAPAPPVPGVGPEHGGEDG